MQLHVDALYVHDARGRLLARNEPGAPEPPRFFLGRTRTGTLWRLAADLPESLVRELARLAARERAPADLAQEPERLAALRLRLEEHAPIERVWRGPALRFPEQLPEAPGAMPLDTDGRARAAERFHHVPELAAREPVVGAFAEGELASVCFAATGPGPALEAGLETLPGFRGRGLATQAAAAWARHVRGAGRIPLYSTAAENGPSRRVARRLGLIAYGWDLHLG